MPAGLMAHLQFTNNNNKKKKNNERILVYVRQEKEEILFCLTNKDNKTQSIIKQ